MAAFVEKYSGDRLSVAIPHKPRTLLIAHRGFHGPCHQADFIADVENPFYRKIIVGHYSLLFNRNPGVSNVFRVLFRLHSNVLNFVVFGTF